MRMSWQHGVCAVLLGGVLGSTWAFDLGEGVRVVLDGFRTRGRGADGQLAWELVGRRAVVLGDHYRLEEIRVDIHDPEGRDAVITSPECTFSRTRGLIESDAPVSVVAGDMILEGVGYDILTAERRLRIRSDVRMRIPTSSDLRRAVEKERRRQHVDDAPAEPAAGPHRGELTEGK